jgi:hypothetical protein
MPSVPGALFVRPPTVPTDRASLKAPISPRVTALALVAILALAFVAPLLSRSSSVRFLTFADGEEWLRYLAAIVPAALIVNHALFLLLIRAKQLPGVKSRSHVKGEPLLVPTQALQDVHFSKVSILARYGIPGLMTVVVCSTAIDALIHPATYCAWLTSAASLRGARAGFAGAYIYSLLLLSQRTFRRDVTSGIALWCASLYLLGPAVGGSLAFLWPGDAGVTDGWTRDVAYFAAGMAPRQFAGFAQQAARRLMAGQSEKPASRTVALAQISGITPEIEDRLAEEGIADATALAMADPIVLLRATSFDRRQIASWMDEALLIVSLPDSWQKLQTIGVPGAIDLAWHWDKDEQLEKLSAGIGMDRVLLKSLARRLYEDAQVRILWTLYQMDSEAEFDPCSEGLEA